MAERLRQGNALFTRFGSANYLWHQGEVVPTKVARLETYILRPGLLLLLRLLGLLLIFLHLLLLAFLRHLETDTANAKPLWKPLWDTLLGLKP